MAGYCIGLYKYMWVEEGVDKKKSLKTIKKQIGSQTSKDSSGQKEVHKKFFTFGEFDRIGFERIDRFERFRDIPETGKGWLGDRQTHLIFDIGKEKDELFYSNGDFYEIEENKTVKSNRLFLGITLLQMRSSLKTYYPKMEDLLMECKTSIMDIVHNEYKGNVKCAVCGTLGSYGLTILWLADQYEDVLKIVTEIRNMQLAKCTSKQKSAFLSAYTIFALNHLEENVQQKKILDVRGNAIIRITLKTGINKEISEKIQEWAGENKDYITHCSGEHDICFNISSSNILKVFDDLKVYDILYDKYILQTNVQLCEDVSMDLKKEITDNSSGTNDTIDMIPLLKTISEKYHMLRTEFEMEFPSTAGMVDSLDLLFSDYISKVSIASNNMWFNNFSHQFLSILESIQEVIEELKKSNNNGVLDTINDLLGDFERQISHIAESNNLIFGTPVCQFLYSGQNNLTLYAYFGLIKRTLRLTYELQKVNKQDEIIPLIVTDVVPIIQSELYFDYEIPTSKKILTIDLPMTALYNPVCYYPYLYHELFHYMVPKDRYIRNKALGIIMSINIIHNILKLLLYKGKTMEMPENFLENYVDTYLLRYVYQYVVSNFDAYLDNELKLNLQPLKYKEVDKMVKSAQMYEIEIYGKWINWINESHYVSVANNFMYGFLEYLYAQEKTIRQEIENWSHSYNSEKDSKKILEVGQEIRKFIEGLAGIVKNEIAEKAQQNFSEIMLKLDDIVLYKTSAFVDAVKEGLADIGMVVMTNLDLAEYLLLMTKVKKDLLIKDRKMELQDAVRTGMVVDFLCDQYDDESGHMNFFEQSRDKFINLYCGLYVSKYKLKQKDYKEKLIKEAELWFEQGKKAYCNYCTKFSIFSGLLKLLADELLVVGEKETVVFEKTEEDRQYWKNYVDLLGRCGNYLKNHKIEKELQEWEEERAKIDKQIFELNIKWIYKFQDQEGEKEKLSSLAKYCKECYQENQDTDYSKPRINSLVPQIDMVIMGSEFKEDYRNNIWKLKAESIESLCRIVAEVAKTLQEQGKQILGNISYPIWYRGQQSTKHTLLPSIMRKYQSFVGRFSEETQNSLAKFLCQEYEEFKFRADGTLETIDRTGYTDSDYIALMQHHSVASNFLDWTEDALSALYFSLEDYFDESRKKVDQDDSSLYIFSPALYNYARRKMVMDFSGKMSRKLEIEKDYINTALQDGIPNLTTPYNASKYYMYQFGKPEYQYDNCEKWIFTDEDDKRWILYMPLAIYVSRLNQRMKAQSGLFLAYNVYTAPDEKNQFDYIALEEIQRKYLSYYKSQSDVCPFLYKIEIDKNHRQEIADWTKAFGMSKEKCYPELVNVGMRIMQ